MKIASAFKRHIAIGLAGAMCSMTPLLAPSASAQDGAYPPCSASVTDHCMQRGDSGWRGREHMAGHQGYHHRDRHHRRDHRHHRPVHSHRGHH